MRFIPKQDCGCDYSGTQGNSDDKYHEPMVLIAKELTDLFLYATISVTLPVTLPKHENKEKKMKKRPVTIQEVAKKSGVSVSTVSRVLNGKTDVAIDTKERILGVIAELGYTTNLAARSMRSLKNNLIGLVVPDIGSPYSLEVMKGIDRAIAASEFDLLLYTTGGVHKAGTAEREHHYVSLLNNSLTDGVLLAASSASGFATNGPLVAVDPHVAAPDYPSVQGTNYQGALDAMSYLLALGHQRIAFIKGRPEISSATRRFQGYKDALEKAGIPFNHELCIEGDFSSETAYTGTQELLSLPQPPSAIFASNDQAALGVFEAARTMDVRIPEDLSVIGFDNISEAEYVGLTTVDQCLSEMGYLATLLLIDLIHGKTLDANVYKVPSKIIKRNSCQPLKG